MDSGGNAYVTGTTSSDDFPTQNPFQAQIGALPGVGPVDAFVAKLGPAGTQLLYSTFLGGRDFEISCGIAVDTAGSAYVIGTTASDDFPTKNAFQPTKAGLIRDAFVTKVNVAGNDLDYSTYLGGSDDQFGVGIAVDSSGNAYVTGSTASEDFPIKNALQASNASNPDYLHDVYVAKLNARGSDLVYSTYLGGTGNDTGFAIVVDSSGSAYVTGSTSSSNFPAKEPLQVYGGGSYSDAFVVKLNPAGSDLAYSTYLGGGLNDGGRDIAVDTRGAAFVTGSTESTDFPVLNAVQDHNSGGNSDSFVAKIAYDGSEANHLFDFYPVGRKYYNIACTGSRPTMDNVKQYVIELRLENPVSQRTTIEYDIKAYRRFWFDRKLGEFSATFEAGEREPSRIIYPTHIGPWEIPPGIPDLDNGNFWLACANVCKVTGNTGQDNDHDAQVYFQRKSRISWPVAYIYNPYRTSRMHTVQCIR